MQPLLSKFRFDTAKVPWSYEPLVVLQVWTGKKWRNAQICDLPILEAIINNNKPSVPPGPE